MTPTLAAAQIMVLLYTDLYLMVEGPGPLAPTPLAHPVALMVEDHDKSMKSRLVVVVLLVHIQPACGRRPKLSLHLLLLPYPLLSLHLWLAYLQLSSSFQWLLPYSVAACAYLLPYLLLVVVHMHVLSKHQKTHHLIHPSPSTLHVQFRFK